MTFSIAVPPEMQVCDVAAAVVDCGSSHSSPGNTNVPYYLALAAPATAPDASSAHYCSPYWCSSEISLGSALGEVGTTSPGHRGRGYVPCYSAVVDCDG